MTSSSQLSVDSHAAIYSVALIIIFKLVGTLFSNLPNIISQCVYHSFIVFLSGLCIRDKNQSAHGIAQFFGLNSHDALTRMLYHNSWSASLLMLELLHQAIQLATGTATPSWLIIDDVILPKQRSIKTAFIGWDYDYVNEQNIRCLRLVVVAWSNSIVCIPVAFALYYKKDHPKVLSQQQRFRTKNQLAQLLVYRIMKKELRFDYLVFDSWYASAENFLFFQKLNIIFVTAIKSNRKLRMPFNPIDTKPQRRCKYHRWYQLTGTELAGQTPYLRDYHYYLKVAARARTYLVLVEDVDFLLKLVCIKNYAKNKSFKDLHTTADKRAKDPNKYLVTNDVNLTIPNIISYYRNRWTIEVMFRDCKQHLALGKCQSHKSVDSQLRHTAMVFLAFTLLELMKSTGKNSSTIDTTIGDIKRYLQHQQLIYVNGQYHLVDISQSPSNWDQINEFTDLLDIKNITSPETQLVFNFKF
jgi:SRSO17 transposase